MTTISTRLPPGVGFVEKIGENYRCSYHDVFISPVGIIDHGEEPQLGCPVCLREEMGDDGIVEAERREDTDAVKGAHLCEDEECEEESEGECTSCHRKFCHEHLYGDRCWCNECYGLSEIDLDMDGEDLDTSDNSRDVVERMFGGYGDLL